MSRDRSNDPPAKPTRKAPDRDPEAVKRALGGRDTRPRPARGDDDEARIARALGGRIR
jgi:hypothetical protein